MNISIKNSEDLKKMRIAGRLAAEVLEMISPFVKPGISTGELDKICNAHIVNIQNAIPANIGYKGYEKTICSSLNQVVCHGIPNNKKILKNGDILNIDVTVIKDGWYGDTSKMFLVGKCAPHNERLVKMLIEGNPSREDIIQISRILISEIDDLSLNEIGWEEGYIGIIQIIIIANLSVLLKNQKTLK